MEASCNLTTDIIQEGKADRAHALPVPAAISVSDALCRLSADHPAHGYLRHVPPHNHIADLVPCNQIPL